MKFDLGYINKIAAVSVKMEGDELIFHYQILRLKKGEVIFDKAEKWVPDLRTLVKKISNRVPIVLHISGKGILNRVVPATENYRHALLMNASLDDFYFTDYVQEEKVYSSVIRRAVAQEILEMFQEKHVEVISLATGPFIAAPLFGFTDKTHIDIDHIRLFGEGEKLVSFEKSDDFRMATFLDDQNIAHDTLGAVALGVQYFMPSEEIVLPEAEQVYEINFKEARQKNIFYRFATGMVFFFLLVLSGNYFYLQHLNAKIENNYIELAEFEDQLAELSALEDEKNRKEKLLSGSGLLNKKFLSYYVMELSNTVPKDVTLEKVEVRPLLDEIKKRHKIEFNERLLMVHGTTKSSEILSRWIDRLKENEWLASVDILDYTYKKNVGNFELEIVMR